MEKVDLLLFSIKTKNWEKKKREKADFSIEWNI